MLYILCAILFVIIIYKYIITPHLHWKRKGIKYVKPTPLFGMVLETILQKKSIYEIMSEAYNGFKNERYFGIYQFLNPVLVISDPDLIKKTTIKDFDSFFDHNAFVSEEVDPLFSKNLFSTKGQKWQALRGTLSPAFTSSKMKMMFVLINNCAEQFTKHFLDKNEDVVTVDMKDILTRYTNDVVATCAFGINCDSLSNPDNDFYKNGKEASYFGGIRVLKIFLNMAFPVLSKIFGFKIISTSNGNFFRQVVSETIKLREEQNIVRPDMIHLLMQARKGLLSYEESQPIENNAAATKEYIIGKTSNKMHLELTDEDIAAQAMIFFIAGFDSVGSQMVYFAYEMAVNKDVQDKLRAEIDKANVKCDGNLTYEVLMGMKYLDMVVTETLRKWPQSPVNERMCTKDYVIPAEKPNEKPVLIEKGTAIWYPVHAIQRNPKYYPNPDKFDPERFNDQNKSNIHSDTFLSFGIGPRNCIGSRFALLEIKVIMFHMLSKFEIVPVKKSRIPVVQSKKSFNLFPEGGMWLGLKKRSNLFYYNHY